MGSVRQFGNNQTSSLVSPVCLMAVDDIKRTGKKSSQSTGVFQMQVQSQKFSTPFTLPTGKAAHL